MNYVFLFVGYNPVLNARVVAFIVRPEENDLLELPVLDNGAGTFTNTHTRKHFYTCLHYCKNFTLRFIPTVINKIAKYITLTVKIWYFCFINIGADVTKDDGIYSGFFTAFTNKGRYSVSVRIPKQTV